MGWKREFGNVGSVDDRLASTAVVIEATSIAAVDAKLLAVIVRANRRGNAIAPAQRDATTIVIASASIVVWPR